MMVRDALACVLAFVAGAAQAQTVSYEVLAVSGQEAPGLPGLTLSTFFDARLNESGDAVFSARLAGAGVTLANERSLWVASGGQLMFVHRQDDPAPFALDLRFDGATFPRINPAGRLGFTSGIFDPSLPTTPPQPTRLGIFTQLPTGPVVMDAENGFSLPLAPINAAGDVAFVRTTGPTGATTLLRSIAGVPEVVLASGAAAPVSEPGWTFANIDQPVLNADGQLVFRASVTDGVTLTPSLWRFSGASLEFLAWADPAPEPMETVFDEFALRPMIGDDGIVTFWARQRGPGLHAGNNAAFWRGQPGAITRILTIGDLAPGIPARVISSLPREAASNTFGRIAFVGHLVPDSEPPNNNSILWVESADGGSFEVVAREGDAVPGIATAAFNIMGPVAINHHGRTAFVTTLKGPGVTQADSVALVAADQIGRLMVIARAGDEFDLGGGVTRRISNISFAPGTMQAGTGTFSAKGEVLFELRFDDKSTAIVTATVGCRADVDGNGTLDIFDFIEFGNLFAQANPRADFEADTTFDIFDFLAFGSEFAAGCP